MFNASLPAALSLVVLLAQALPGQQPRDAPPPSAKAGTAAIRGRVFNLETGLPIRRASVMLMVMPTTPPRPPSGGGPVAVPLAQAQAGAGRGGGARAVRTDQAGRFEFTGLTAGTYRLRVSPNQNTGAYLAAAYGASDSREPGKVIELKEGQQFDTADVPLQRGGAVTGRIIDDGGDPLSRVNVYVSRTIPGGQGFQRTGGGLIQSDDHGRYRIYGLEPGDYIVTAETRGMGGPPVDDPEPEGFVATHHPGTASQRDAVRVRVRAGLDADGIDIQMIRTRTFRITGTIMDSQGRTAQRVNAQFVMSTRRRILEQWRLDGSPGTIHDSRRRAGRVHARGQARWNEFRRAATGDAVAGAAGARDGAGVGRGRHREPGRGDTAGRHGRRTGGVCRR